MQQLLYISSSRKQSSSAMIDDILRVSRRNNARDGLSGLLIVGGRRSLQVLEGEKALVDGAYRRIERDPRHYALVKLGSKELERRSFPDCEMGYRSGGDTGGLEDLDALVARLTECVEDPSLRAHLRSFALLHSKAA